MRQTKGKGKQRGGGVMCPDGQPCTGGSKSGKSRKAGRKSRKMRGGVVGFNVNEDEDED
jgi:hypothetical protein